MTTTDFALSVPLEMHGSAQFAADRTLRREIRRWWVPTPTRWAAWLMLNPSAAGEYDNDPTALRVTRFTQAWGYDGWIGVNLYPFISSAPAEMWAWADWEQNGPDWYARDAMQANLGDIERVGRMAALRVVAFGAEPIRRCEGWLEQCLEAFGQPADVDGTDEQFYCLGVNGDGQPLHPMARGRMRVRDGTAPQLWSRAPQETRS